MRVAIVHDWLTGMRGGEKVLLEVLRLFPEAEIFTLFHRLGAVVKEIECRTIRTSWWCVNYRLLLPLFSFAAETWRLSRADVIGHPRIAWQRMPVSLVGHFMCVIFIRLRATSMISVTVILGIAHGWCGVWPKVCESR